MSALKFRNETIPILFSHKINRMHYLKQYCTYSPAPGFHFHAIPKQNLLRYAVAAGLASPIPGRPQFPPPGSLGPLDRSLKSLVLEQLLVMPPLQQDHPVVQHGLDLPVLLELFQKDQGVEFVLGQL
jgi:hypothetical protein